MRVGRVIGNVTFSDADPAYRGGRWLVVSPVPKADFRTPDQARPVSADPSLVVYDNLGAGTGDVVGFVEGAEATAPFPDPIPIDAICVALIDQLDYRPPREGDDHRRPRPAVSPGPSGVTPPT